MDEAREALARAVEVKDEMNRVAEAAGLTLVELETLVFDIRRTIPPGERRRVENRASQFLPQERRLAGSSVLTLPLGIRG